MIKGTTKDGFNYSVDPDDVKDMRVIELMAKTKHDGTYFPELASRILGDKQKERLYKHLEDKKGRVSPDRFGDALDEIMTAINNAEETKN